jgi:hypothetical protein
MHSVSRAAQAQFDARRPELLKVNAQRQQSSTGPISASEHLHVFQSASRILLGQAPMALAHARARGVWPRLLLLLQLLLLPAHAIALLPFVAPTPSLPSGG